MSVIVSQFQKKRINLAAYENHIKIIGIIAFIIFKSQKYERKHIFTKNEFGFKKKTNEAGL